DPEHGAEPGVLADALVHHVLEHASSTRVVAFGPDAEIVVPELAPDAHYLDAFGFIAVDQEFIWHGSVPLADRRVRSYPDLQFCRRANANVEALHHSARHPLSWEVGDCVRRRRSLVEHHKKLAILVGGGPAPGINSVIGAATIRAALEG